MGWRNRCAARGTPFRRSRSFPENLWNAVSRRRELLRSSMAEYVDGFANGVSRDEHRIKNQAPAGSVEAMKTNAFVVKRDNAIEIGTLESQARTKRTSPNRS